MPHQFTVEALICLEEMLVRVLYLVKDKKKKILLGKDSEGLRKSSRFLSVFVKCKEKPTSFLLQGPRFLLLRLVAGLYLPPAGQRLVSSPSP